MPCSDERKEGTATSSKNKPLSSHSSHGTRRERKLKEMVEAQLVGHVVQAFDRVAIPDALSGSLGADLSSPLGAEAHKRVDEARS
jgi:hypothetical protein